MVRGGARILTIGAAVVSVALLLSNGCTPAGPEAEIPDVLAGDEAESVRQVQAYVGDLIVSFDDLGSGELGEVLAATVVLDSADIQGSADLGEVSGEARINLINLEGLAPHEPALRSAAFEAGTRSAVQRVRVSLSSLSKESDCDAVALWALMTTIEPVALATGYEAAFLDASACP